MARKITIEHPGTHAPTRAQLKDAGIDYDAVYDVNESGVATTYTVEGDEPEDETPAKPAKKAAQPNSRQIPDDGSGQA